MQSIGIVQFYGLIIHLDGTTDVCRDICQSSNVSAVRECEETLALISQPGGKTSELKLFLLGVQPLEHSSSCIVKPKIVFSGLTCTWDVKKRSR